MATPEPDSAPDLDLAEIVPRLVRFYGGSPMEWLGTPVPVVLAHMRMMPVIQAEELLDQAAVANLGRFYKRQTAISTQRQLRRAASSTIPAQPVTVKALRAVGVGVKIVPGRRRRRIAAGGEADAGR